MNSLPSNTLTLRVVSFSYRDGYPAETAGNGGGFIFDCRYLHNPGRYEEYKSLTGRDVEVQQFLEERGEVQSFLSHAEALVDMAIAKYLSRGFEHLFVGFGCTGGQHRSVYCAESLARYIKEKYSCINVEVTHLRQEIAYTL